MNKEASKSPTNDQIADRTTGNSFLFTCHFDRNYRKRSPIIIELWSAKEVNSGQLIGWRLLFAGKQVSGSLLSVWQGSRLGRLCAIARISEFKFLTVFLICDFPFASHARNVRPLSYGSWLVGSWCSFLVLAQGVSSGCIRRCIAMCQIRFVAPYTTCTRSLMNLISWTYWLSES